MARRKKYESYLIDIEGVLVRDKRYEPVPGSREWFNGLQAQGVRRVLVSNNTSHTPEALVADLVGAGFDVEPGMLVSALAAGAALLESWGKKKLLWLGMDHLARWWREQGFTLVESGDCDAVVLGINPDLTIADIDRALPSLVDHDAELVALHRNFFYLDGKGERRFGPGFYCGGLETVARNPAVVVGKPQERIYREALKRVGSRPEDALFISDDPVSDLVTARRMGMGTAFVLSGKYSDHEILGRLDQQDWPDIITDRPASLENPDRIVGDN